MSIADAISVPCLRHDLPILFVHTRAVPDSLRQFLGALIVSVRCRSSQWACTDRPHEVSFPFCVTKSDIPEVPSNMLTSNPAVESDLASGRNTTLAQAFSQQPAHVLSRHSSQPARSQMYDPRSIKAPETRSCPIPATSPTCQKANSHIQPMQMQEAQP